MNEIEILYKVRKTIYELLEDRGYRISEIDKNETLDEFKTIFIQYPSREELTFITCKKNNENDRIIIFFPSIKKVGMAALNIYTNRAIEEGIKRVILVIRGNITSYCKTAIFSKIKEDIDIED